MTQKYQVSPHQASEQTVLLRKSWIMSVLPSLQWYGADKDITGLSWHVDSRQCGAASVFVALAGDHDDGHRYVQDALHAGAQAVWIAHGAAGVSADHLIRDWPDRVILVSAHPQGDMIELARAWRVQQPTHVIGVTGSVGKTGTKELIAHMIRMTGHSVYATRDNQNALIGNALNILSMPAGVEFGVFEMGISKQGEMAQLARLVQPRTAVITYLGHSHLQGLGTIETVAAEKRHIFDCLQDGDVGIVCGDNPLLATFAYKHPVVRFGKKTSNHVQARKIKITPQGIDAVLKIYQDKYPIHLDGFSVGRLYQVMAALATAAVLKLPLDSAVRALHEPIRVPGRLCVYKDTARGKLLVDDAYNANPESMREALATFDRIPVPGNKVAVLGDMLELGPKSAFWHRQLGRMIAKSSTITEVILVGSQIQEAMKTVPPRITMSHVDTWTQAVVQVRNAWGTASALLIKGSHGTQLHMLAQQLRQEMV